MTDPMEGMPANLPIGITTTGAQPMTDWNYVGDCLPENGVEVLTKIDNEKGCRNETTLKRQNRLWFFPDMSMYVYYEPTHWKPLEPSK